MKNVLSSIRPSLGVRGGVGRLAVYGVLLGACIWTFSTNDPALAEDDAMGMQGTSMAKRGKAAGKDALADELRTLRKQVGDLRTVVERRQAPARPMKSRKGSGAMGAMPKESDAPVMGSAPAMAMDDDMDMMGAMPAARPAGGKPSGGMAMDSGEMGAMGGSPPMQGASISNPGPAATMAMEDDMDTMGSPAAGSAAGMGSGGMVMDDDSEMGGMGSAGTSMQIGANTGSGKKAMGCCMGSMGSMGGMGSGGTGRSTTSLPGFPGRSHLYHIGAEGFFLNHPQHITLTLEQRTRLNQIREQALLANASYERKVAEAEQALFVLTGADLPDAAKIGDQSHVIASLRVEQRLAFIRAVGEAAQVLTDSQREALLGK